MSNCRATEMGSIDAKQPLENGLLGPSGDISATQKGQSSQQFILRERIQSFNSFGSESIPNVDVIQVAAICPNSEMHSLESLGLGDIEVERTDYVYRLPLCRLLMGGLTLTTIENEAKLFLRELRSIRNHSEKNGRRAIIFVAYDFGAILVKTALSLARKSGKENDEIFYCTAATVFARCPQRNSNIQELERTVFDFLIDNKRAEWLPLITLPAVRSLARAVRTSTNAFVGSKITLRCRVISIYSGEVLSHSAFGQYTATLGLPSEFVIEEQEDGSLPGLIQSVAHSPQCWIPHPLGIPWERFLLAVSSAHCQSEQMPSTEPQWPGVEPVTFLERFSAREPQILYLYGKDPRVARNITDQVAWKLRANNAQLVSFIFDSMDPLRDSIADFIVSALCQVYIGRDTGFVHHLYCVLQDQYLIQDGWTDNSLLSTFEGLALGYDNFIFLLHDFDECDEKGRNSFLRYIEAAFRRMESSITILVTSRKPAALVSQLEKWSMVDVGQLVDQDESRRIDSMEIVSSRVGCIMSEDTLEPERSHLLSILERLSLMEVPGLETTLEFAQRHTGWPRSLSYQSLSKYIMILETIEPNNSTAQIVDRVLRSHATDDGFYWILTWLVGSARPLSHVELTNLLCEHYATHSGKYTIPKHGLSHFERAWQQLVTWFNGVASFDQEHITFRLQFRDIILNDELDQIPYLWYEARQNAHQTITEFCLSRLTSPDMLQKFGPLLEDYLDQTSRQHRENTISPPMVGDEEDISFYVIQFLPFHLARCPHEYTNAKIDTLLNASSPSTLWARLHWAMSNPLSRPPEMYKSKSALPVLAGLRMLPCERLSNASDEKDFILLAAAYGNQGQLVQQLLQDFQYSLSALIHCLQGTVSSNDESTAVKVVQQILDSGLLSKTNETWPSSLIWATAGLNMYQLADILLRAGAETDPNRDQLGSSGYIPSPLFLATRLGHASTVRVFLDHNARIDVARHDDLPLMAVAIRDRSVIEEFLAKDRSYLKSDLVFAYAVSGGAWECIPRFAAQNCDFNALLSEFPLTDRPMTPLVLACLYNYPRTVLTLLRHGANPDLPGPWCPLWLATIWAPNAKSLRHLLQHGANPNSDRLNLPLLLDLVSSPLGVREILLLGDILLDNHPPLEINALDPGSGRSALMQACRKGQLPIVTWLLDRGADAGILDHNKESALHYAIRGKHSSAVRQILTSRPWLATIDQANEPLLNLAIPNIEICSLLLDAGADPMCYNHRGQAPMNYAAMAGSPEIMQMLIERGVNLDYRDSWGWTVICDAVLYGKDVSTLRLLIESGSDLAVRTWTLEQTLLHLAVYGSPEVFKVLLEHTKVLSLDARDIYTNTPLLSAESNANIHCLTLLVNVGANINLTNKRGETALHNSFYSNMPAFRDLLLSQTDLQINVPSVYSGTPLHLACTRVHLDGVISLLDHGADVNQITLSIINTTPLHSVLLGSPSRHTSASSVDQIVRTLVKHGADVMKETPNTFHTPLAAACFGASTGTIHFLLDEGADPQSAHPGSGTLPIHFAAANGAQNFQLILQSYRCDVKATDNYGKGCLHWAAQFGKARTIAFLLSQIPPKKDRELALAQADKDGWTPLCWAMRPFLEEPDYGTMSEPADYLKTVRLLLDNGADPTVHCYWGERKLTCVELAQRCGADVSIVQLLRQHLGHSVHITDRSNRRSLRRFRKSNWNCDICLGPGIGLKYVCSSCPNYHTCTKCHLIAGDTHSRDILEDGQHHIFQLDPSSKEYQGNDVSDEDEECNDDFHLTPSNPHVRSPTGVNQNRPITFEDEDDMDELQEMDLNSDSEDQSPTWFL